MGLGWIKTIDRLGFESTRILTVSIVVLLKKVEMIFKNINLRVAWAFNHSIARALCTHTESSNSVVREQKVVSTCTICK